MAKKIFTIAFLFVVIASCNNSNNKQAQSDTPSSGTIYISVDESFKPVIEHKNL